MAKKYSNGKRRGKAKKTTLNKLKAADVETIPFQFGTTENKEAVETFESKIYSGIFTDDFNTKFDNTFIKLKAAPHTPWYTKLLNFFKKL